MKRNIAVILALILIVLSNTAVMAHPEPIVKKTFDLKTDTIIVKEKGTKGSESETKIVKNYEITHITADGTEGNATYNMYYTLHQQKLATSAILKVDISSLKNISDFNLNFSFAMGSCKGNYLKVFFIM